MPEELTSDEVASLIRARKIINAKGLPRDIDVQSICTQAGISRKTGYQWAAKTDQADKEEEDLRLEFARLKEEHEKLKRLYDDVRFENEGRKLAWEIHGVDKLLAKKKGTMNCQKERKP